MIQTRQILKQWFKKYAYPTEQQFWDWLDSYWHKDDSIPASQIEGLQQVVNGVTQGINDVLNQKQNIHDTNLQTGNKEIVPAINELYDLHVNLSKVTVFLPIHAQANSVNITEPLSITGIVINRNCSRLFFVDKDDINNTLEIECLEQPAGEVVETDISLEQFNNKPVFILVAPATDIADIDISLTLKKI